jgi:hypothetical protein
MARMGRSVAGKTSRSYEQIRLSFFSRQCVIFPVTTAAVYDLQMFPLKDHACFLMIEILGIQKNDGLVLSLVFCMADNTVISFIAMITSTL